MKTGSGGREWVQLDHPKPPRVPYAVYDKHWAHDNPPEHISPRCAWWMDQIVRGWRPNRRLRAECYDCSAGWYGVYIWEYLHLISPALDAHEGRDDPGWLFDVGAEHPDYRPEWRP